jgi:hypothetical protein
MRVAIAIQGAPLSREHKGQDNQPDHDCDAYSPGRQPAAAPHLASRFVFGDLLTALSVVMIRIAHDYP